MAYWNIDDSSTETPSGPNGWVAGVDNNHGDIRYCGTIADTALWTSTALGEGNEFVLVVEATGLGTTGVQTTTAFNLNGSGGQVIIRATTDIADIRSLLENSNKEIEDLQKLISESNTK